MIIQISLEELRFFHKILKEDIAMAQSTFLAEMLALIETIHLGDAGDPAVKKAVTDLTNRATADEVDISDLKNVVKTLATKLAQVPAADNLPVVSSLSPASGSVNGGETITVNGSGFSVSTPTVAFGSVAATSVSVIDDTKASVVTPAQAAATVDVIVTTSAGASVASDASKYTYA